MSAFSADLSDLRFIGVVDLPKLAYTYAAANSAVNSTVPHDQDVFTRPGSYGWDDVYDGWTVMRDEVQNILGRTALVLEDLAATMVHIVDAYAATDHQAAVDLDRLWPDGTPPPSTYGPAEVPPPPGPMPEITISGTGA